jgi:hypothetical protein
MSSFPKHWLLLAAVSCASPQTPPAAAPAASIAPAIRPSANARVAVLGLRSKLGLVDTGRLDLGYLGDRIRASALNGVPSLNIISRENVLVLLESSGKPIDECEGECEVETGRRVGADLVISGEALSVEGVFKISLKLHDTHSGRMLSGSVASGKTFQELDGDIHRAVFDLLRPAFGTPRSAPQPLHRRPDAGWTLRNPQTMCSGNSILMGVAYGVSGRTVLWNGQSVISRTFFCANPAGRVEGPLLVNGYFIIQGTCLSDPSRPSSRLRLEGVFHDDGARLPPDRQADFAKTLQSDPCATSQAAVLNGAAVR